MSADEPEKTEGGVEPAGSDPMPDRSSPREGVAIPAPAPDDPTSEVKVSIQEPGMSEEVPAAASVDPLPARTRIHWQDLRFIALVALVAIAATTAGAVLFSASQAPEYRAEVDLVVDTSDLSNIGLIDRRLETLTIIGASTLVTDAVAEATGIPAPDVRSALQVDAVRSTTVIRFRATRPDQESALALVTAVSERFPALLAEGTLQQPPGRYETGLQEEMDRVETELDSILDELVEIDAQRNRDIAAGLPVVTTARESALLTEYETLSSELFSLRARLLELEFEQQQVVTAILLGEPREGGATEILPMKQAIAIGAFVGMVLGGLAALALLVVRTRSRADKRHEGEHGNPAGLRSGD